MKHSLFTVLTVLSVYNGLVFYEVSAMKKDKTESLPCEAKKEAARSLDAQSLKKAAETFLKYSEAEKDKKQAKLNSFEQDEAQRQAVNDDLKSMQRIWKDLENDLSDLSEADGKKALSDSKDSKEEEKTKLEKEKAEFLQSKKEHQEDILQALTENLKEYVKTETVTRQTLTAKDRQFQKKLKKLQKKISDNQEKINAKETELVGLPSKISDEELAKHIENKTRLENMLHKAKNEIAAAEVGIALGKKILEKVEENIVKIAQYHEEYDSDKTQSKKNLKSKQMDLQNKRNAEKRRKVQFDIYMLQIDIEKGEEWFNESKQELEENKKNKDAAEKNIRELTAFKDLYKKMEKDIRPKLNDCTSKIDTEKKRKELSDEMNSLQAEQEKLENEAMKLNEEYQKFSESKLSAELLFKDLETDQEEEEEKKKSFEERLSEIDQLIVEIDKKNEKFRNIKNYAQQLYDIVNNKLLQICGKKKDGDFYFSGKCLFLSGNRFRININEFFYDEKKRQESLKKYKDFFENINEKWKAKSESFVKEKNRISENMEKLSEIAEILKQVSDNAESYIESLFGHMCMSGHFTDLSMQYTRTREDIEEAPGVVTSFIADSSKEEYLKKILKIFGKAKDKDVSICYNTKQLLPFNEGSFQQRVSDVTKNCTADSKIIRLFVKCSDSGLKGCYFKRCEGMKEAHVQDIDLIIMRLEQFEDSGIALSMFPLFDIREKTGSKFSGNGFENSGF